MAVTQPSADSFPYVLNRKGGSFAMMNIVIGAILVIGIVIAVREIRKKD